MEKTAKKKSLQEIQNEIFRKMSVKQKLELSDSFLDKLQIKHNGKFV